MHTLGVISVSLGVAGLALTLWARAKAPTPLSNYSVLAAVGALIAGYSQFFVGPMELKVAGSVLGSCIVCYAAYRIIKAPRLA